MKRNEGFTLVELMVTILVGSIVTLAATTVLLLGLRINKKSSETAIQQNTTRILYSVLEEIASEGTIKKTVDLDDGTWKAYNDTETVFSYDADAQTIYSRGAPLMENVLSSSVKLDNNLLIIKVETEDGTYESSVYCRTVSNEKDILKEAIESTTGSAKTFLEKLASQEGSTGQIVGTDGKPTYYSEWYLEDKGGYANNPGWNENTPWCVCFISWAMEESEAILDPPKCANVDDFWKYFEGADEDNGDTQTYKTSDPKAGDIIFFDWIVDDQEDPQHAGVVLQVKDGYIYTIEGNTDGIVAVRKYAADDKRILGYGILNWPE